MRSHEIDYKVFGDDIQFVVLGLDPGETAIAEAGNFMMMDNGVEMETIFGDGSESNKGFGSKLLGAGKRLLTGESLFMTAYTNEGTGKKKVSFAAPYPGKIVPLNLSEYGEKVICQKDSFLCAAKGVSVGLEFSKKLSAGFFGGEGFVLQKLEGDGMAFVHGGGAILKLDLDLDEILKIETGCLIAMTQSVRYDIEFVKSIKSMAFGGQGVFNTTLQGPGTVWIQSMPFSKMADRIYSAAAKPSSNSGGSLLGSAIDIFGD